MNTTSLSSSSVTSDRAASAPLRPAEESTPLQTSSLAFQATASAGSLGVRGLISEIQARDPQDVPRLLHRSIEALRNLGVRRAHIIVDHSSYLKDVALKAGFKECPGEHLYQCALLAPPSAHSQLSHHYNVRNGTEEDLIRIGLDLTHVEELAFKSWEFPLIRSQIGQPHRFFKVVEHGGSIVGVSIGGCCGSHGTISHTWVAPEHRNHGLGQVLSDVSLAALHAAGARFVHLMTTAGNSAAERFWQRQGFSRHEATTFLEIDL